MTTWNVAAEGISTTVGLGAAASGSGAGMRIGAS